jgi:hypothetical protein
VDRELMKEAAELYALPADEFTAARNARAKELRKEEPDLAGELAKLPKPTAAAAAINRIARDDPSEVRALVQAGKALRSAQEAAVAGKSGGTVAEAAREHREAVERVRREARRLDLSAAVLDRVTATLRAASTDPELQPLLERGLLAREQEAAGFGLDPSLVTGAPAKPKPAAKPEQEDHKERRAQARAELRAAQERLTEAKRTAAAAEKERKRLEKQLAAAVKSVDAAQADVEEAEQAVEQARARTERG